MIALNVSQCYVMLLMFFSYSMLHVFELTACLFRSSTWILLLGRPEFITLFHLQKVSLISIRDYFVWP